MQIMGEKHRGKWQGFVSHLRPLEAITVGFLLSSHLLRSGTIPTRCTIRESSGIL